MVFRWPDLDFEYNAHVDMEASIDVMNSIAETVPDPTAACEQRSHVWDRILQLVGEGVSTGSRTLDRLILQGRDRVEFAENTYNLSYVPTPEEHFQRQDPGESGVIFRPSLMIFISDQHFDIRHLDALVELGRKALPGRAVLRDHPVNLLCFLCFFLPVSRQWLTMIRWIGFLSGLSSRWCWWT